MATKNTLSMFYYQPYWGFIICKLSTGPELYHPFGYSHQIIDNKIYIPTRHFHRQPKWEEINSWALGLPLDPKQNPLNFLVPNYTPFFLSNQTIRNLILQNCKIN
jgi:hypothetical protein